MGMEFIIVAVMPTFSLFVKYPPLKVRGKIRELARE